MKKLIVIILLVISTTAIPQQMHSWTLLEAYRTSNGGMLCEWYCDGGIISTHSAHRTETSSNFGRCPQPSLY